MLKHSSDRSNQVVALRGSEFKTWKTIKLGPRKSVRSLRMALDRDPFGINIHAADVLSKTEPCRREVQIQLTRVTVRQLGFERGAYRSNICERAYESGLLLCPAVVGPELRLQYTDQQYDETLVIAMKPILGSGGLTVFIVDTDPTGLWLSPGDGSPNKWWDPDAVWVFVRRK